MTQKSNWLNCLFVIMTLKSPVKLTYLKPITSNTNVNNENSDADVICSPVNPHASTDYINHNSVYRFD